MNRGGLYRLDLSCFLTIRSDATKPAIISVVVFLSIANQTMVMSDNIVVISSEIPIMTLNDNASIEVDNIHLGSFMNDSEFSYFLSSLKSDETSHLWHMRLSHPSTNLRVHMPTKHVSTKCASYAFGKSKRQPHSSPASVYSYPLELVQVDLWGLAPNTSSNNNFCLSIVDAFSRYTWIDFLHRKSDAGKAFYDFHV